MRIFRQIRMIHNNNIHTPNSDAFKYYTASQAVPQTTENEYEPNHGFGQIGRVNEMIEYSIYNSLHELSVDDDDGGFSVHLLLYFLCKNKHTMCL